ncbi:MAG: TIGR03086 family metal-binding protein [Candidatus Nanopelagicales bacterium]
MGLPDSPAELHREVAATFTSVVDRVKDWDAPTPVDGWTTRDVVGHLTTWFPEFLQNAAGIDVRATTNVAADPVGTWAQQVEKVQAVLDDPLQSERSFQAPHIGQQTVSACINMIYIPDVFMHSWDLARGAGVTVDLDDEFSAQLLGGMTQMEAAIRGSGQYGPAVEVPVDASTQDKLFAFIGRNHYWPDGVPSSVS